MEADIVKRCSGRHHPVGIEPRRQRLQVDEGTDEQAGSGQQHYRECNFAGDEGLAQAVAASSR